MSPITQRLGFGCGRLAGGWESSNSQRLLEAALECGIRYFDTAPYYGGGASERLVGRVLQASGELAQVCTKVGLYPQRISRRAGARSMLIAGLRAALPDSALQRLKRRSSGTAPATGPRSYGNFDPARMRASLDLSLEALRRVQVDGLLLHEPAPSDPQAVAADMLDRFVKEGKVKRLGVGTYAALEDLPRFGSVAQFAIGRGSLIDPAGRGLIVHGLLRHVDLAKFANAAAMADIPAVLPILHKRSDDQLFLSAVLLNVIIFGTPVERIIVSSSSPQRLKLFLRAAELVHAELGAVEMGALASRMRKAASLYLGAEPPQAEC